mgnify:CR=1 FL=1
MPITLPLPFLYPIFAMILWAKLMPALPAPAPAPFPRAVPGDTLEPGALAGLLVSLSMGTSSNCPGLAGDVGAEPAAEEAGDALGGCLFNLARAT